MNIRREKMLKLREELLAVEEDRMRGSKGYSVDEVVAIMRDSIKEAAGLNQLVMESTERGQNADKYVRELKDNDRF